MHLSQGSNSLGETKPSGCVCKSSPQHTALLSLAWLPIDRTLLCWGMVSATEPPHNSVPTHGDKGKVCLRLKLKYLAWPEHGQQLNMLLF